MPSCESCGQAANNTVTIARNGLSAGSASCDRLTCLLRAAWRGIGALGLTEPADELGCERDEAPPKSGRRRKGHLRLVQ